MPDSESLVGFRHQIENAPPPDASTKHNSVFSSVRLRLINRTPKGWLARYEMSDITYKDCYEAKPLTDGAVLYSANHCD